MRDETVDLIVYHRTMSVLMEMGLDRPIFIIDDFDDQYSIKNQGPFRYYTFHIENRDDQDLDEFSAAFRSRLEHQNEGSAVKPDLVEVEYYPGPYFNFSSIYVTVAV